MLFSIIPENLQPWVLQCTRNLNNNEKIHIVNYVSYDLRQQEFHLYGKFYYNGWYKHAIIKCDAYCNIVQLVVIEPFDIAKDSVNNVVVAFRGKDGSKIADYDANYNYIWQKYQIRLNLGVRIVVNEGSFLHIEDHSDYVYTNLRQAIIRTIQNGYLKRTNHKLKQTDIGTKLRKLTHKEAEQLDNYMWATIITVHIGEEKATIYIYG